MNPHALPVVSNMDDYMQINEDLKMKVWNLLLMIVGVCRWTVIPSIQSRNNPIHDGR